MGNEKKSTKNGSNSLSEFALIDEIKKSFVVKNDSSICGIGDDAAILKFDNEIVVTTDMLTEGVHFDLMYTPLKHLGYKAVAVNVSDICAMNAIPTQITVSIAVSSKMDSDDILEIYEGIAFACKNFNIDLIGGDTTSSFSGLIISVTAFGVKDEMPLTKRSDAKVKDLICVSGDLGAAYVGLQLLEREKKVFEETNVENPDFGGAEYLLERILKPEPRIDILNLFREKNIKPNAMIDISDGLSSEILHICKSSEVGCRIYQDKLPISQQTWDFAEELNLEPTICALNGGEDYELLFTIPLAEYERVKEVEEIKIIGHIADKAEGNYLITKNDTAIEIMAQGWTSF